MENLKRLAPQCLALMMVAFFSVSILISYQESTTMDEKAHIPAGYSYVKYQDMRINPEHPPMLKDFAGLFLLPLSPLMPKSDPLWESGDWLDLSKFPEGPARTWGLAQWAFGDKILHLNGNDANLITFWARFPFILVSLLLGFFVYRWTRELAGTVAGLFAAMLYFFDPNIIAHSHYVTTDIGIAAFIFFSFYFFVRFLKNPSRKNIAWSGIFLGLAQLAKFSAVLLFPIFGMFAVLYGLAIAVETAPGAWKTRVRNGVLYGLKYMASVAICFVAIWILYFFNTMQMPGEVIAEIARAQFPNDKAIGRIAEASVVAMSQSAALKPLAEYFLGVFMVFARVAGGNTFYFLGQVSNHASQWYFPVVFVLKETIPMLFLIISTTLYTLFRMAKALLERDRTSLWSVVVNSFRERIAQCMMAFFILFYSYVSITGNLNIGYRHLFPILPFLYVLVAKTVFDILKREHDRPTTQRTLRILLACAVFSIIAIPVLSYPSYLSYFNAIGGGHKYGYQYVTDSNYDWGQDLRRLRGFVDNYDQCVTDRFETPFCEPFRSMKTPKDQTIRVIRVDYFGGSNPKWHLGDRYQGWHSHLAPEAGWYALSIGFLQENWHKALDPGERSYAWLRNRTPDFRVGDSIFVYYISPEELLSGSGQR
ncbi:MAG: phospholipid carrier-dependent glycosyltransferase [Candidatus Moraniibacteriota bacterium]|nr:MAG: phospholipid carrier-dependent glycosyltransferase [Candidatus Moranbacteria bacterium]